MAEEYYNVAESDVASVNWQEIIASADEPDCIHYFTKLHSAAEDAKANGNDIAYRVFRFLANAASLHLNAESAEEPFGPMIRTDKGRSVVVEDYSDKDLGLIRSIIPSTSDPEFRARLADILWLRTDDRDAAETAVDAYFESAARLEDPEMWPRFMPQFERAFRLAAKLVHAKAMRERVEKHIHAFPLTHLFSAVAIDERGRVTAKRPSLLTSDIDEREAGIRAEMFHQAQIEWQVAAQAFINPARLQIIREHHTSPTDLAFLVQTNPFVPSGREAMFARGIHAGLIGDFLLSAHLLVPQLENSLGYVLALNAVVTSKLDSRLIQEERDLGSLLSLPEVTEIFGEDFVFELRGLLIERFGVNLRNRLAHGLIDQQVFQSVHVLYFWWIILRLLFIPIAQSSRSREAIAADEDASAETVMPAWAKDAAVSLPAWTKEDAAEFERRAKAEDPGV